MPVFLHPLMTATFLQINSLFSPLLAFEILSSFLFFTCFTGPDFSLRISQVCWSRNCQHVLVWSPSTHHPSTGDWTRVLGCAASKPSVTTIDQSDCLSGHISSALFKIPTEPWYFSTNDLESLALNYLGQKEGLFVYLGQFLELKSSSGLTWRNCSHSI